MSKGCWKGAWPSWGQGFARSGKLIFSQCTLSPPSENIRKPSGFLMPLGGRERLHWEQMG